MLNIFRNIKFNRKIFYLIHLLEFIFLNLSLLISFFLHFGNTKYEPFSLVILVNLLWLFLCYYFNRHKKIQVLFTEQILSNNLRILFVHFFVMMILIVLSKFDHISRLRILYFYLSIFIFLSIFEYCLNKFFFRLRLNGYNSINVILSGNQDQIVYLSNLLKTDISFGYNIVGYINSVEFELPSPGLKYLGTINNLIASDNLSNVNEIYLYIRNDQTEVISDLINYCDTKMIRLKIIPEFEKYTKSKHIKIDFLFTTPILSIRDEPLQSISNRLIKRTFDILISFILLFFCLIFIFPWIILLIKLSSKGPILFKQLRMGEDGNVFKCLKFRTMYINSDPHLQATLNDPRVTSIGKFLRTTSLDELPQLLNVLWGSMSLVGPRPHPISLSDQYKEIVDKYLVRHYCKPGITGLAQINGYRGETKEISLMLKRVEFDIWYIENWSFLLDFKILLKTFLHLFKNNPNAY